MKIAMVTKYYNRHQGIPRVVAEISESLSVANEVHVYAREWECDPSSGIRFHKVPQIKWWGFVDEILFFFYAGLCLRFQKFDIVNIHDPCFFPEGIFTCHAFPMGGIRTIDEQIAIPWKIRLLRVLPQVLQYPLTNFNIKSRKTRKIIAVSQFIKNTLVRHAKIPESRISVVHNGVDMDVFNPARRSAARAEIRRRHKLNETDFVISFVGYYLARKGLALLFSALSLLKNPSIKVLVVGQKVEESPLYGLLGSVVPKEQVISVGMQKNVSDYMVASDLFVLPAFYEAFGNVVLEAMACGVPVIVSNKTGAAELVRSGESGYVLDNALDGREFADKIGRFVQDRALSKKMGNAALATARENGWDTVVERTVKVYADALSEERRQSEAP